MASFENKNNAYYIEKAAFCVLGEEWNQNNRDAKNNPLTKSASFIIMLRCTLRGSEYHGRYFGSKIDSFAFGQR